MSRSASHVYEPPVPSSVEEVHDLRLAEPASLVYDSDSLRAIDRAAVEEYGIPSLVLMENAARGLADEAMRMLRRTGETMPHVLIFCGSGNNGGDGYAAARHLHNCHVDVTIVPIGLPRPDSDAGVNQDICTRMGLRRVELHHLDEFVRQAQIALMIDAIFGTGLDRPPTGLHAQAIEWINDSHQPVLAADIPSGLNGDTGEPLGLAVRATRTVTFVGLKTGFIGLDVQKILGDVVVKDIGAPRELLERFGQPMPLPHLPHDAPEHKSVRGFHLRRPGE